MFKCEFCEKELKTKSNIVFHQKTAKYCLEKQGKENINFKCNYCKKNLQRNKLL
jgi:aspartate carbamoyltransferase regulatory subunit